MRSVFLGPFLEWTIWEMLGLSVPFVFKMITPGTVIKLSSIIVPVLNIQLDHIEDRELLNDQMRFTLLF